MKICSVCGETNEDWVEECIKCGHNLANYADSNTSQDYGNYDPSYNDGYSDNYNDQMSSDGYGNYGYDQMDNGAYVDPNYNMGYDNTASVPVKGKENMDLKIILVILLIILFILVICAFSVLS